MPLAVHQTTAELATDRAEPARLSLSVEDSDDVQKFVNYDESCAKTVISSFT